MYDKIKMNRKTRLFIKYKEKIRKRGIFMGFIKAFTGALSGTFADEWKDFYKPAQGVSATAAILAKSGISVPLSPDGYPCPSNRS